MHENAFANKNNLCREKMRLHESFKPWGFKWPEL